MRDIVIDGIVFNGGNQNVLRHNISFLSCQNITIENCTFTGGYGYALRLNYCENVLFQNCNAYEITGGEGNPGGWLYGISFEKLVVQDCVVENLDDHMIYVTGDSDGVSIINCVAKNTGAGAYTNGAAYCIYGNAQNVSISKCVAVECRTGYHISSYGSYDNAPSNVSLTDCTSIGSTVAEIEFQGESGKIGKNISIAGCYIQNNGGNSLTVDYYDNILINGNIVKQNGNTCVRIGNTNNVHISDNMIDNTSDTARNLIVLGYNGVSADNVVSNNLFNHSHSETSDGVESWYDCIFFRASSMTTGVKKSVNNYNVGTSAIDNLKIPTITVTASNNINFTEQTTLLKSVQDRTVVSSRLSVDRKLNESIIRVVNVGEYTITLDTTSLSPSSYCDILISGGVMKYVSAV